eukprot:TRINITY_DN27507_c1_g2_i4.p1 TRINITY_DN27507_c1_g2~~TRINITY_DN27507_c1_g2_i4.p1  ORF type:complete len:350 (-),score=102.88 TRINITY_DN27507_c1_g2_i4:545-1540(-)
MAEEEKALSTNHLDQEIVQAIRENNLAKLRDDLSPKLKSLKPTKLDFTSDNPNYLHFTASLGDNALTTLVLLMEKYPQNFNFLEEFTARGCVLHLAAEARAKRMIQYLLSHKEFAQNIDKMVSSYTSITTLGLTVQKSDFESFTLLVQKGADLNFIDQTSRGVLDYGLQTFRVNKDTSILWQILDKYGGEFDKSVMDSKRFFEFVSADDEKLLETVINLFEPNLSQPFSGMTPLMRAAFYKCSNSARVLLNHRAHDDLSFKRLGKNALEVAQERCPEIADMIQAAISSSAAAASGQHSRFLVLFRDPKPADCSSHLLGLQKPLELQRLAQE